MKCPPSTWGKKKKANSPNSLSASQILKCRRSLPSQLVLLTYKMLAKKPGGGGKEILLAKQLHGSQFTGSLPLAAHLWEAPLDINCSGGLNRDESTWTAWCCW